MNNDYVKDYLMHHGVPGQKWGVRRLKEKAKKEEYKTKIAESKAKQAELNKVTKEFNKTEREKHKETVRKGKEAASAALAGIGIFSLAVLAAKKVIKTP